MSVGIARFIQTKEAVSTLKCPQKVRHFWGASKLIQPPVSI